MFVFNPKKLRKLTVALVSAIAAGTLTVQVEWVKNHVNPLLANHPHLSSLSTGVILILTILHNPKAQKAIKDVLVEEVSTDPATGNTIETKKEVSITEIPADEK